MAAGRITRSRFNVASTGVDTNIFTTSVTPKQACAMAIDITLQAGAVLSVAETEGATTVLHQLNSGAALTADHAFSLMGPGMVPGRAYNLRSNTDVGVRSVSLSQVRGGVL